jgi:hypothetical protein
VEKKPILLALSVNLTLVQVQTEKGPSANQKAKAKS